LQAWIRVEQQADSLDAQRFSMLPMTMDRELETGNQVGKSCSSLRLLIFFCDSIIPTTNFSAHFGQYARIFE
jgi:hypothetical protein